MSELRIYEVVLGGNRTTMQLSEADAERHRRAGTLVEPQIEAPGDEPDTKVAAAPANKARLPGQDKDPATPAGEPPASTIAAAGAAPGRGRTRTSAPDPPR